VLTEGEETEIRQSLNQATGTPAETVTATLGRKRKAVIVVSALKPGVIAKYVMKRYPPFT
jgi:hypothetical protein